MASIFKRGTTWYVKYYVNGKQVYESLHTRSERAAKLAKKRIEADEVRGDLLAPSRTHLGDFLQDFCEFLSTIRTSKSYSADTSLLRVFFGPLCPALQLGSHVNRRFRDGEEPTIPDVFKRRHVKASYLEDVTPDIIEGFLSRRIRLDGISPKTANRQREILHRMFEYAIKKCRFVSQDRRYPNPAAAVDRRREPAPEIRYLATEQIDQQLQVLEGEPTLRTMVALYIYAGLRREAGCWLTVSDVDLERRLLHVRAKTIDEAFWQPKTKRNRVVPISTALHAILSDYQPPRNGPWYFPTPHGRRWDPDNLSQRIRKINRAAGLPWSCLDFRHTFGSHLAQKGESLYKIAGLMGNSPEICRKHYAALAPEKMHDTVEFAASPPPVKPMAAEPAQAEQLANAVLARLLEKIGKSPELQPDPQLRLRIAR